MQFKNITSAIVLSLTFSSSVSAGIITYGICQTGCNAVAVACYAAAGVTFGTIAAPLAPPAILGCNAALGTCSTACAAVTLLSPN